MHVCLINNRYRETVRNVTAEPDYRSSHSQGVQDHILNKIFNFIAPKHKSLLNLDLILVPMKRLWVLIQQDFIVKAGKVYY